MSLNLKAPKELGFPDSEWTALQDTMESGGVADLSGHIQSRPDKEKISELYEFAQTAFFEHQWAGKSLDLYADIARAGIAWHLEEAREADREGHPLTARRHLDVAARMSCRLAHHLSSLWCSDEMPRGRRHAKLGLAAAKDCIRWLEGRDEAHRDLARVWWVRGLHELSLALHIEARRSFDCAKTCLRRAFGDTDRPMNHQAAWWMILCEAFNALADHGAGSVSGLKRAESLAQSLHITSLSNGSNAAWPLDWPQERAYIALCNALEKFQLDSGVVKTANVAG